MAAHGRSALRDLFDESPTPHIAHPPRTHHRDYYVATDGSFRESGEGGLGVVVETREGDRVLRLSVPDAVPDNNVAEYRALHLGLDVLAERAPASSRVGVLVDHDALAEDVNADVLAARSPDHEPHPTSPPPATANHWRGIRARLRGFDDVRAARIDSDRNPAHPLANTPSHYEHVNEEPDRCVLPSPSASSAEEQIPPPSRADRNASD